MKGQQAAAFLKLLKTIPGLILKTQKDFPPKIEGLHIATEAVLVTINIASLYTNILLNEVQVTIEKVLKYQNDLQPPQLYF